MPSQRFLFSAKGFATLSTIGFLLFLLFIFSGILNIKNITTYKSLATPSDLQNYANSVHGSHSYKKPNSTQTLSSSKIVELSIKPKLLERVRFHYYNPAEWVGPRLFDDCSYRCFVTFGKTFKDFSTSQFVIFHGSVDLPRKPPQKIPGQTWIYHSLEPPFLTSRNLKSWRKKFNWTVTYRRDSDFTHTYGTFWFHSVIEKGRLNLTSPWENKTKGAAWFVSHLKVQSKREMFAKQMKKFMNVDIYGRHSKLKCPSRQYKNCYSLLRQQYKFYLSFENALCRDYITEKCFNIFADNPEVVPVVRGVHNYSIFLPSHSYIDTTKFPNISRLTKFQNNLAKNKSEFEEYFQWRKYYYNKPSTNKAYCELCERAHSANSYRRLYNDIYTWLWGEKKNTMCRDASDIK